MAFDALLVVSPEHGRVFREAGWDRARLLAELEGLLTLPADELLRGAGGIAEGVPEALGRAATCPSSAPAACWSCTPAATPACSVPIIGGWVSGETGSVPGDHERCAHEDRPGPDRRAAAGGARAAAPPGVAATAARVGLLDISKARGDVVLDRLEELLDRATACVVRRYRKPTFARTAPVDLRHEIAEQCEVVIEALAD